MISILYLIVWDESLGSCQAPSEEQCGIEGENPELGCLDWNLSCILGELDVQPVHGFL